MNSNESRQTSSMLVDLGTKKNKLRCGTGSLALLAGSYSV